MLGIVGSAWAGATAVRASLYNRGLLRRRRLERPVVSVGALSVGGDGKTPTTAAVCLLLSQAGYRAAILSRGYRRRGREPLLVSCGDGQGPLVGWNDAGDEPYWLATVLPGVAVAVATRREEAAGLVLEAADVDLFVLDDGFQHLRVERDADLLVVDPRTPFWSDSPLPAGRLRERRSAAGRADAFLVSGEPSNEAVDRLTPRFPDRPVFPLSRFEATVWPVAEGFLVGAEPRQGSGADLPAPALAFAGIARPQRFFDDLAAAGVGLAGTVSFPDHHAFTFADLERVAAAAREGGAAALVTTEKDAVRLPDRLPEIPCWVWSYRLRLADGDRFLEWLEERTGLRRGTRP